MLILFFLILLINNVSAYLDPFGITKIYPSAYNETYDWYSRWHIGPQRNATFGLAGGYDPLLIYRGSGSYSISGNGYLTWTGSAPRLYVRGSAIENSTLPDFVHKWENIEATAYFKTIDSGLNISYAGFEIVGRTNHYPDKDDCSTAGYGAKFNWDGRAQFEKECSHANGSNKQIGTVYPFNGKMPLNVWIGMKFVIYSNLDNTVVLELYLDMTDGLNGGNWQLVSRFIDFDGWSGTCLACSAFLTGKILGPNYSIYLRTDGNALQVMKKLSVREISVY